MEVVSVTAIDNSGVQRPIQTSRRTSLITPMQIWQAQSNDVQSISIKLIISAIWSTTDAEARTRPI